jgi:hypothetical protein
LCDSSEHVALLKKGIACSEIGRLSLQETIVARDAGGQHCCLLFYGYISMDHWCPTVEKIKPF